MLAGCLNEDTLGPGVKGCRDDFDFTIKFEQLVFSVLPSVLLIVASIWRVRYLSTSVVVVHAPLLQSLKLVSHFAMNVILEKLINILFTGLDTGIYDCAQRWSCSCWTWCSERRVVDITGCITPGYRWHLHGRAITL